jgi:TolB-like protein/Flp pilus assembly protein TadD
VPPRLRDVVRRCLTKEAEDRPRDIGDLRRELVSVLQELSTPASGSGVTQVRTTPSLAVLYFENTANDPESEYFCAGITEDILTDLSKIKGLRVASRNAVARYRGTPVEIAKVAAELGVKAVLEGSVRRAGDRVRITAQLINGADGFHLWAERYDRSLQDVFAVQEEIASAIATALRVALTPSESQNLVHDRPSDARAYDLYLKGRECYGRYTAESLRQALDLFRQAIAVDADYALAYAGVADCCGQMMQWGGAADRDETLRAGLEAAERAISLSPKLADGYKAKALVLRFKGDKEGAHAALRRAVEVNPRFVPAIINLAVNTFCRADLAATERLIRRALDVDPQETFATTWLGFLAMLIGRDDEVLTTAARLRKLTDQPFYVTAVHYFLVWALLRKGDLIGAEQGIRQALADGAEPNNMRCVEAMIALRSGRFDEAKRVVAEMEKTPGLGSGSLMMIAAVAIRLGDLKRARGFMTHPLFTDLAPIIVRLDPALHPLLDRPPFAPRRWEGSLVWPLESPMIDAARHALFREVRIESGLPMGSEVAAP